VPRADKEACVVRRGVFSIAYSACVCVHDEVFGYSRRGEQPAFLLFRVLSIPREKPIGNAAGLRCGSNHYISAALLGRLRFERLMPPSIFCGLLGIGLRISSPLNRSIKKLFSLWSIPAFISRQAIVSALTQFQPGLLLSRGPLTPKTDLQSFVFNFRASSSIVLEDVKSAPSAIAIGAQMIDLSPTRQP